LQLGVGEAGESGRITRQRVLLGTGSGTGGSPKEASPNHPG